MRKAALFVGFALLASAPAHAQRSELWTNPGLSQRGIQSGEQQLILRQDMAHCHGAAYESAREAGLSDQQRKALGVELFKRCMADKGWSARPPGRPKPPTRPPRETAT